MLYDMFPFLETGTKKWKPWTISCSFKDFPGYSHMFIILGKFKNHFFRLLLKNQDGILTGKKH